MVRIRTALLGLVLTTVPLLGGDPQDCLSLSASQDSDVHSPSGIRVTVSGYNRCSKDIDGGRSYFKVTALGSGNAVIGSQSGRFGGTVTAHGRVETKVFVTCDPDRVRTVKVEAQ